MFYPYKPRRWTEIDYYKMYSDWYWECGLNVDAEFEEIKNFFFSENGPNAQWVINWLEKNPAKIYYDSMFKIPYSYIQSTIYLKPIKALEYINVTFDIK